MGDGAGSTLTPGQVRRRILSEHQDLRRLLTEVTRLAQEAREAAEDSGPASGALRDGTRRLHAMLMAHLDLEDRILVPAIRDADGFGPVRAQQLAAEHAAQREELEITLGAVARAFGSGAELATHVARFADRLQRDMDHEEKAFLTEELLRDDIIRVGFIG